MYTKIIINEISILLTSKVNKKPIVVCQEDFIKNIPANVFEKITTIVVSESLESASSLRNYIHFEGMQQNNIDIIEESHFRRFNPDFDYIFIDKESKSIHELINWIVNCQKNYNITICLICNKSLSKLLFNKMKLKWKKFHGNWCQTELVFKRNKIKKQDKAKFIDESILEDDNGKIL